MSKGFIAVAVAIALVGGVAIGTRAAAQSAPSFTRCAAVIVPVNSNTRKATERGDYNNWVSLPDGWTPVGGATTTGGSVAVIACTKIAPTTDGDWTQDPL